MKKFYSLFTCLFTLLLLGNSLHAQGIYQLWGTASGGGIDNKGVLFSTRYDGSGQAVKKAFLNENPGSPDSYNTPVLYNNKLYCMLEMGGDNQGGVIAVYDPGTGAYSKKANLSTIGAAVWSSSFSLTVLNGKLYGVTAGIDGTIPVLFEFDPATNALVKKYSFTNSKAPAGDLVVFNNKLYGITSNQSFGTGQPYIYEFDPANNQFTKKLFLDVATTGNVDRGSLIVYNNLLWSIVYYENNGISGEYVNSYNPANNQWSQKASITAAGGKYASIKLTLYNNRLYGTTELGGLHDNGIIFEFNPANNALVKKIDLTPTALDGSGPLTVLNNKLYGHSSRGGIDDKGVIYSYDPLNNIFATKVNYGGSSGINGCGGLTVYNNKLYGLTASMAEYGNGCLFAYDPAVPSFDKLVEFGSSGLWHPNGIMIYYNGKFYGTARSSGYGNQGGIFTYDPVTNVYTIQTYFYAATGAMNYFGGITLYNNKFYGVTADGGATDEGTLFEYDPATNEYTKIHDFASATGKRPLAAMTVFNGKLYGTCVAGSTNDMGNIFQYDPVTKVYAQKVILNQNDGKGPSCQLLEYNGRLYGTTFYGGSHDDGVLFEYFPQANGFVKLADFENGVTGREPTGQLCIFQNKLYGCTEGIGNPSSSIFSYDFATDKLTQKLTFDTYLEGKSVQGGLTLLNNKMYGVTNLGGDQVIDQGTIFEYDPVSNMRYRKTNFTGPNGQFPQRCQLVPLPALVAPGSPGSCVNTSTVDIQATKSHDWIPFTDNEGRAVAEINANGNVLGNVTVRYFINDGNVRKDDKGTFYLDRNITITVQHQPTTPVTVRFYARRSEVDVLKGTAGSGVATAADISVFHNNDFCQSSVSDKAYKIHTTYSAWGTDHVYTAEVSSFSSFYFATNMALTLPIHVSSFTGKMLSNNNQLTWKASCTNAVDFTVERSSDGINFTAIGSVAASVLDCALPFTFNDNNYLPGKNIYRLRMNDQGAVTYSKSVLLDRTASHSLQIAVLPNPVTGPVAHLRISSPTSQKIELLVTDMTGRLLLRQPQQVASGTHDIDCTLGPIPAGVYSLRFFDGSNWQSLRFVKQ